jgi:hypothetical protein
MRTGSATCRTSKQVDVKVLKETLWTGLQCAPGQEEEVRLRCLLIERDKTCETL